jgi:hypothetical protein
MNKYILFTFLLTLGCSPSAFAMDWHSNDADENLIAGILDNNEEVCKESIAQGANLFAFGRPPLCFAAQVGSVSICRLLLEHAQDQDHSDFINIQDPFGNTPLIIAVRHKKLNVIQLLIENGADIYLRNCKGKGALYYAHKLRTHEVNQVIWNPLITHVHFNSAKPKDEQKRIQQRILTALCVFQHLCPNLPKDIRALILMNNPELRQDFCSIPAAMHKNKHSRTPFMPIQTICTLLQQGLLDPQAMVAAIKEHHCKCRIPLMEEALMFAKNKEMKELPNLETLEANFGAEIEQNIKNQLGITQPKKDSK